MPIPFLRFFPRSRALLAKAATLLLLLCPALRAALAPALRHPLVTAFSSSALTVARQSDLRAFLERKDQPAQSSSTAESQASTSMTAAKRTRSSTSADTAASTSQPSAAPASKRSRRSPSKEEKPRIKPDPDEEDDEGHDPRFDSPPAILARAAREETFPAEMDQTPLAKLYDAMHAFAKTEDKSEVKPNKDGCVVYWSRCAFVTSFRCIELTQMRKQQQGLASR